MDQSFYLFRPLNFDTSHVFIPWWWSHHHQVFLNALSWMLSFGKNMSTSNFSWARNNRPNYSLHWLKFLLKVSTGFQCDVSCYRLPWAGWCFVVWIFYSKLRCWLPQFVDSLNLVCARVQPNQPDRVFRAGHFSHQCHTFLVKKHVIEYASTFGICRSVNFSSKGAKITQAVLGWPGFCVICNFTKSNEFFVSCYARYFDNCFCCFCIRNWLLAHW